MKKNLPLLIIDNKEKFSSNRLNLKFKVGFTLLEILVAISIFSLIALVLAKVFTVSTRTAQVLEGFSYESKQVDIFLTNISKMLSKIYLYPVFTEVEGYEYLSSNYKLSLKCPLYIEKSRGFSAGTEIVRFIQYNPDTIDNLRYGLVLTEIKAKSENGGKSIYFSVVPIFFNENVNKEYVTKARSKEYLLLDNVDTFKVLVLGTNNEWQDEFSCKLENGKDKAENSENPEGKKDNLSRIPIPQFIKIVIEKKVNGDKLQQFSYTIKLF